MKKIILFFILIPIVVVIAWLVNSKTGFISISETNKNTAKTEEANTPKNTKTWQFAVIGDTEEMPKITDNILTDLAQRDLDFIVHLGDITYKGGVEGMEKTKAAFDKLPYPTYYVPGNNDLIYDAKTERKTLANYQKVINQDTYYSLDYENAHLVFLDNSYLRVGFSDEELTWLEQDLNQNNQEFTFLFYHRPLDVPGQQLFGDDETPESRIQNEKFKNLIADYTIDRIFNGHLHMLLTYTLNDIPITITGGGGALPQALLGGAKAAYYHYQLVTVYQTDDKKIKPTLEAISFE